MPAIIHAIDVNGDLLCGADRQRECYTSQFSHVSSDEQCQDCALAIREGGAELHLPALPVGTTIRTTIEDCDDDDGIERTIPVGAIGIIRTLPDPDDPDQLQDIAWHGGAWTRWTPAELHRDAVVMIPPIGSTLPKCACGRWAPAEGVPCHLCWQAANF